MKHMYTLQRASDIGLNQCILSQAGMNAVVCALTEIGKPNNLDTIVISI